jgi:hypothetical protein
MWDNSLELALVVESGDKARFELPMSGRGQVQRGSGFDAASATTTRLTTCSDRSPSRAPVRATRSRLRSSASPRRAGVVRALPRRGPAPRTTSPSRSSRRSQLRGIRGRGSDPQHRDPTRALPGHDRVRRQHLDGAGDQCVYRPYRVGFATRATRQRSEGRDAGMTGFRSGPGGRWSRLRRRRIRCEPVGAPSAMAPTPLSTASPPRGRARTWPWFSISPKRVSDPRQVEGYKEG